MDLRELSVFCFFSIVGTFVGTPIHLYLGSASRRIRDARYRIQTGCLHVRLVAAATIESEIRPVPSVAPPNTVPTPSNRSLRVVDSFAEAYFQFLQPGPWIMAVNK